jgi:hypothetical protein
MRNCLLFSALSPPARCAIVSCSLRNRLLSSAQKVGASKCIDFRNGVIGHIPIDSHGPSRSFPIRTIEAVSKTALGAMYGRTTVRPIVDTATTNAISTNLRHLYVVVASPSVHCIVAARSSLLGRRCSVVDARSSMRAITFAQKLRCAPFFRSHPSPLLTPLPRRLQCRCCEISTPVRQL